MLFVFKFIKKQVRDNLDDDKTDIKIKKSRGFLCLKIAHCAAWLR